MNKGLELNTTNAGKRAYTAPTLSVFGGLRELTLEQTPDAKPEDNSGTGKGGKPGSA